MMMHSFRPLTLVLTGALMVLMALSGAADAAEPRAIGKHRDWNSYQFTEAGSPVCYMASQPTKSQGNYTRRGDIFALITHRPGEGTRDTFSFVAGYTFKQGSDVTVQIGNRTFTLFTSGDTAWARDAATDSAIAEAIRAGITMVVKGISSRGTRTTDTFSLRGSSAAYSAITDACY